MGIGPKYAKSVTCRPWQVSKNRACDHFNTAFAMAWVFAPMPPIAWPQTPPLPVPDHKTIAVYSMAPVLA
jgi:hypothetical protein